MQRRRGYALFGPVSRLDEPGYVAANLDQFWVERFRDIHGLVRVQRVLGEKGFSAIL